MQNLEKNIQEILYQENVQKPNEEPFMLQKMAMYYEIEAKVDAEEALLVVAVARSKSVMRKP